MTNINKLAYEFEAWGVQQIFFDKFRPDLAFLLTGLGIAIPRQVNEIERFTPFNPGDLEPDIKEVDCLRLSRTR
jgi:hypothetical protein